jgi:hypothetical protein
MSYPVIQLINDAWYLSGIVARQLQTVDGTQVNDGLNLFNFLVSEKTLEYRKIPYYQVYNFNAVIGQETYFIPGLVECDTFTFFIPANVSQQNTIRYSMTQQYRKRYFGSARAENIDTLPFSWHIERALGGSNLYVYFFPDQTYPMQIWGRFALPQFNLFDDLSLVLELFYIQYLRYDLAAELCRFYNIQFLPENKEKLLSLERSIAEMSPYDLSMIKLSTLNRDRSINYAQVNVGKGWGP